MIVVYLLIGVYALGMLFIFIYSLARGICLNFSEVQNKKEPISPKSRIVAFGYCSMPIFYELYVVERLLRLPPKSIT